MDAVDTEIRAEFCKTTPDTVPPHFQHLFTQRNLQDVLAMSNYQRRNWLTVIKKARAQCTRRATNQTRITDFFSTASTP